MDVPQAMASLEADFDNGLITAKGFLMKYQRIAQFNPTWSLPSIDNSDINESTVYSILDYWRGISVQLPASKQLEAHIQSPPISFQQQPTVVQMDKQLNTNTDRYTLSPVELVSSRRQLLLLQQSGYGMLSANNTGTSRRHSYAPLLQQSTAMFPTTGFSVSNTGRPVSSLLMNENNAVNKPQNALSSAAASSSQVRNVVLPSDTATRRSFIPAPQQPLPSIKSPVHLEFLEQQQQQQQLMNANTFSQVNTEFPPEQQKVILKKEGRLQEHKKLQACLKPRDLSSVNTVEKFDSLPFILRQRGKTYSKDLALITINSKNKDVSSISWEKLYLKAEKIAQQITKKSGLYKGDRVLLIYNSYEVIDFAVAFFGALLAGMVAVPIGNELNVHDIAEIMKKTGSKLSLVSDTIYKQFERLNNDKENKFSWPKGVIFWKTKDMGTYSVSKRHDLPPINLPDLAYIEFSKYPIHLQGVVISHKTVMHQMSNLTRVLSSNPNMKNSIQRPENIYKMLRDTIFCTSDIRCSSGLVMGLLFNIYAGTLLVWTPESQMDVPGFYANAATKYRASILISDLLGLKSAAFNYQADPDSTRKYDKKRPVNLSTVKWCIVNCLTVNNEVLEIIADRWLNTLGCKNAREAIAPALSLSEYGGMVISIRDWIGKEENMSNKCRLLNDDDNENTQLTASDYDEEPYAPSELSELLIDKESLSTNTVKILSYRPSPQLLTLDQYKVNTKFVRVGAFGFPLLDATLAIVNPETLMLSEEMQVGEIWVDSPCISGGYWENLEATNKIFRARCRDNNGFLDANFLRTGLLGFVFEGKVYVLGLYEDRFRQKVSWIDTSLSDKKQLQGIQEDEEDANYGDSESRIKILSRNNSTFGASTINTNNDLSLSQANSYTYHYVDHISSTVFRKVAQVECSTFDVSVNGEYVPVTLVETSLVEKTDLMATIDYEALESLAYKTFDAIESIHKVRLFCIGFCATNSLPRAMKGGRIEIATMLCKNNFLAGSLKIEYVKFNIKKSISNIPHGLDVIGGIWSKYTSEMRTKQILDPVRKQFTGKDTRDVVMDERSQARLSDFKTIIDVFKWRVLNQPDTLAYSSINDSKKSLSFNNFEQKVLAICQYIINKTPLKTGDHVILMYNLSEDFVCMLYACFMVCVIPIPMMPMDPKRPQEDCNSYFRIIKDFNVKMVFTHNEVESQVFKNKQIHSVIKTLFSNIRAPIMKTTNKMKNVKNMGDLKSKISTRQAKFNFRDENTTVLVCLDWTPDGKRIGIRYSHKILLNQCKILKETFKMGSFNSILSGMRHVSGIGLIQSAILGVYLGSATYLSPENIYFNSPNVLFSALSNYKIKDCFLSIPNMDYAVMKSKQLQKLQFGTLNNLMIDNYGRPNTATFEKYKALAESSLGIQRSAVNATYSNRFNPIITSRSYLNFEPVEISLDLYALRNGMVQIVSQNSPKSVKLQDSGVVLTCTQIAIVNPETLKVCKPGEIGEIWINSEGTVLGATNGNNRNSNNLFVDGYFNIELEGFEGAKFLRTCDLGFLHSVIQQLIDQRPIEVQLLYVLGKIGETFEFMGLQYFSSDIEKTIENCHPDMIKSHSLVFKSEGYIVAVCCTKRSDYFAGLAPLIFKNVLDTHELMIDIVAFLPQTHFEFSRFNEKRRSTMINKWANNQMKFNAIYGINRGEISVYETFKEMELVLEEESSNSTISNNIDNFGTPLSSTMSISEIKGDY